MIRALLLVLALSLAPAPLRVVVSLDRSRAESGEAVVASVSVVAGGPVELVVTPEWGEVVSWSGVVSGSTTLHFPVTTPLSPTYGLYGVEACAGEVCSWSEPLSLGVAPPDMWLLFVPLAAR